ncbi:hypothetical protein SAMN05660860_01022 [Geoalkalibacter ferrihydriticus]|uniref:Response regulatory domain-containing protein n=2 Tax=Geoalkalibacter ferrihydriticus TaxID=392333 RepID=A0A0C2EG30_9BACT|nr:hypothetical protein [Geoalkalibacter ferrihydriticus]KIH77583.1 hypothetical protein GFER_02540 [Geoalkalibacter ferrihydriticus DSM 17813]SDL69117.1 hypothetical protein SAMN05660860_01022 [Geoalkalibacter ferrihydriticus]
MQRAVVDSVLKSAMAKIAEEVASLMGEEFKLSEPRFQAVTKPEFFATPRDKCAYSRVSGSGDFSGEAAIILPLKDAVLLGGTLIMLPADEVAEKIKNPTLDGEEGDAFGEVANIIVGAVTAVFEDLYPKKLHFKKTESEVLIPTKVDLDADAPFPPGHYHLSTSTMTLEGKALGALELLFPFALLGLPVAEEKTAAAPSPAEQPEAAAAQRKAQTEETATKAAARKAPDSSNEERQAAARVAQSAEPESAPAEPAAAEAPEPSAPPASGVARNIVDNILGNAFKEIAKDLSDLTGQPVKCAGPVFQPLTKAEYLALPRDKGALARMEINGDHQGEAFLIVRQRDAILFGGTLIMLPNEELAAKVKASKFEGEEADAYGEVANIITGSLTKILEEQYPRKLHLKRTELEPLIPTKVDPEGATPFAPGEYYLATCQLALEKKPLGELDLLFPAAALDIKFDEPKAQPAASATRQDQSSASRQAENAASERGVTHANAISSSDLAALQAAAAEPDAEEADQQRGTVLVVAETAEAGAPFGQLLQTRGQEHQIMRFQDNLKQVINGHKVYGVFLVMNQVSEQGFATAIKIKSALPKNVPLVMAGPEWTRTSVLKAVRYGVRDILVTPADSKEIAEKLGRHMVAATAP